MAQTKILSPTQAEILATAAQHPARLAEAPPSLPEAARNAVFRSMLGAGLLEGVPEGTKQHAVLTLLRRAEGATITRIMEATRWAQHTVRGFLAGLKKKDHVIEVLERVRQVGPGAQGAKGSYSVYQIEDAAVAGEQG